MRRNCLILLLISVVFASAAFPALAKLGELDIKDPGLLPVSPFYFLKEWRRGLVRIFTSDPISKASLELRIVDEKASEIKKVEELKKDDTEAIKEAISNYKLAFERLQEKLSAIAYLKDKQSSELVEQLFNKAVLHEKFLRTLAEKYKTNNEIQNATEDAKRGIEELAITASKGVSSVELPIILKKSIATTSDDELKNEIRAKVVEKISESAPTSSQEVLNEVRMVFLQTEILTSETSSTSTMSTSTDIELVSTTTQITQ